MNPNLNPQPVTAPQKSVPNLVWIDRISRLMDSRFTIPGTRFKFGLDPILGLLPIAGDAASLVVSGTLIMYMARYGASRKLVMLMVGNVLIDTILGAIPLLGNIFDFYYKANDRNVRLLRQYYTQDKHKGKGTGLIVLVLLIFALLIAGVAYGTAKIFQYIVGLF